MILFYDPPAQGSITLPLAQAICITRGGKPSPDLETPENHELLSNVKTDNVRLQTGGFGEPLKFFTGREAEEMVHRGILVHIVVNINDVHLLINEKTTLEQALQRYHHKLKWLDKHHHQQRPRPDEHQRE